MSLELVDTWLSDHALVTQEDVSSAIIDMYDKLPTGDNLCVIAALSEILQNNKQAVLDILSKHKQRL